MRSHGWGWTPASVEGWLVVLAFIIAIAVMTAILVRRVRDGSDIRLATTLFPAAVVVLVGVLIAVAWLTGERPRWHWDDR